MLFMIRWIIDSISMTSEIFPELFGLALQIKYNVILVSSGEDCIDKYIDEKKPG